MNEFSILCRIIGSLFNRHPQDPLLAPLFMLIREGKLAAQWPLEQDALLKRLQQSSDPQALTADYEALFVGESCNVSPFASHWPEGKPESEIRAFLTSRGMPLGEAPTDHFGALLLAASWLEDQSAADESAAQLALFDTFLMPWCGAFLGKVEAHATTAFYRTLAELSREAIQAMYDELVESASEQGDDA